MQVTSSNSANVFDTRVNAGLEHLRKESSPVLEAFSNYSADIQEVSGARAKREAPAALETTLKHVGTSVNKFSSDVRQQLDEIVNKIQGMNIEKIQVNGYALFFRELATPRATAVKDYLGSKGVDQNVIFTKGYGPGFRSDDYTLGRDSAVEVKVYGTPKDAPAEATNPVAKRSVTHLIA